MLHRFKEVFERYYDNNAFCINKKYFKYSDFADRVSIIQNELIEEKAEGLIGIFTHDNIDTYAAIIATLFSGNGFVPLNHKNPIERNKEIADLADIKIFISVKAETEFLNTYVSSSPLQINPCDLSQPSTEINFDGIDENKVLCILFTSGSTGIPKGVPYTMRNINSTIDSFFNLGYNLDEKDRFLQMFDLTFDMSLLSYLTALYAGATIYTVPDDKIKYMAAFRIMTNHDITFAAMVPTTLSLLRPYFNEMKLEKLRFSILGGEPFYYDIAKEWSECIPNARIINISGPTEITMACMGYELERAFPKNKTYQGVLSFGKAWKNTKAIIINEKLEEVKKGEIGELCFSGDHVMSGYWKDPEKNREVMFRYIHDGNEQIFYRTGDMAFMDEEGDYMSCGRSDKQVKIQGFKVELGEIEHYARDFTGQLNVAAIEYKNNLEVTDLHLFVEGYKNNPKNIIDFLNLHLPYYMVPSGITILENFPLNKHGKINLLALRKLLLKVN